MKTNGHVVNDKKPKLNKKIKYHLNGRCIMKPKGMTKHLRDMKLGLQNYLLDVIGFHMH